MIRPYCRFLIPNALTGMTHFILRSCGNYYVGLVVDIPWEHRDYSNIIPECSRHLWVPGSLASGTSMRIAYGMFQQYRNHCTRDKFVTFTLPCRLRHVACTHTPHASEACQDLTQCSFSFRTLTMDDLINLMETNGGEDDAPNSSSTNENLESLIRLMGEPPSLSTTTSPSHPRSSNCRQFASVTPSSPNRQATSVPESEFSMSSTSVEASVDDRLGIRMLNRNISSIDLLDLLSTNPYHSPATLSFMSLAQLTKILIDPPRIVDEATVNGKTSVVTVGIVFSNTGTRLSSKGNAFCILTIGTFNSGPCISVMLFGSAYAENCRLCTPGKVVALIMPTLMPKREFGGKTTMSFSVHDNRQFLMVATARDYGTCQANVSTKRVDGKWTSGGSCKNYVDKRLGQFCESHRKCKSQNSKLDVALNPKQRLRKKLGQPEPISNISNSLNGPTTNMFIAERSAGVKAKANLNETAMKAKIGIGQHAVPMHMTKSIHKAITPGSGRFVSNPAACTSARALQHRSNAQMSRKQAGGLEENKIPMKNSVSNDSGDWLNTGAKRRAPLSSLASSRSQGSMQKKSRKVNTLGAEYDGSVFVPKPSAIFASRKPKMVARPAIATRGDEVTNFVDAMKKKQFEVASLLNGNQVRPSSGKVSRDKISSSKHLLKFGREGKISITKTKVVNGTYLSKSFEGEFSNSVGMSDLDKVRTARSRFANEADAEQYAKSRQAVNELEKLESGQEKKKSSSISERGMKKEWTCLTCDGKKFSRRPASCICASHKVRVDRVLIKESTTTENRMKLQEKTVEDGGLRLGSGLEWTRNWSRFS